LARLYVELTLNWARVIQSWYMLYNISWFTFCSELWCCSWVLYISEL